ncbi:MAG: hypothetical protein R8K20_11925 [Gallionellaceae bacterium]
MANGFFNNIRAMVKGATARAGEVEDRFDLIGSGFDGVEAKTLSSIKLPAAEGDQQISTTPAGRADKLLGFDANGIVMVVPGYVEALASTASDVATTNADVVLTHADVVAANSSAGAATTQATAASVSASTAAVQATDSSNSAGAALLSERNAASIARIVPAVNALLPAITIVDDAYFDNSYDPDWLDRCAGKSWYNEARSTGNQYFAATYANDAAALVAVPAIVAGDVYYNGTNFMEYGAGITYRAGSQKFPMKGFVTAETGRVIIWDTTHGAPTMWAVAVVGTSWGWSRGSISSVGIKANVLVMGCSLGVLTADLVSDELRLDGTADSANRGRFLGGFLLRNYTGAGSIQYYDAKVNPIVNATVKDVAITILPDAPIDLVTGVRVPTIAVGTNGGVSVINDDGTVVNETSRSQCRKLVFLSKSLILGRSATTNWRTTLYKYTPAAITILGESGVYVNDTILPTIDTLNYDTYVIRTGRDGGFVNVDAAGGFFAGVMNTANPAASIATKVHSTYNTGYMVGDIRRAISYDSNSVLADRSVKAGSPVEVGTLTKTVTAGGRTAVSGFSANAYIQEPTSADFNAIGTGDFSIIWNMNLL